jgi:hypothetical protein
MRTGIISFPWHLLLCVVLSGCTFSGGLRTEHDEFVSLFDGKTLDDWETPDTSYWSIEDGAITGTISEAHPCTVNQYLVWRGGEIGDFELKLAHRLVKGSPNSGGINGGFQFRSLLLPDHDVAGYQVDNNHNTPWLVRLYDEHGRHDLALRGESARLGMNLKRDVTPIEGVAGEPAHFRLDEWHEYHLIAIGNHVELRVNGVKVAEFFDEDPTVRDMKGILALQLHSGPPMKAQFKDIRLKKLPAK